MKDGEPVKVVLRERTEKFCDTPELTTINQHRSPIFEALLAAARLDMFGEVLSLIRGVKVWSKESWKSLTWKKGWILNDAINNIRLLSHREMDLFREVQDSIQYSVWWVIADHRPDLVYISETMVKLLSHASDLKTDNPLLKSGPRNLRVCTFCNTNSEDSAFHMILQCDDTEMEQ